MEKPINTIPIALRKVMVQKGIRQVDIVNRTGLSKSYLSMVLNGSRTPDVDRLRDICSSLSISLSSFFLEVAQLEQKDQNDHAGFKKAFEVLAELDDLIQRGDDNDETETPQGLSPIEMGAVLN